MSIIECSPKTLGALLSEKLDAMDKTHRISIDFLSRISISIDEPLTIGEKQSLINGLPAWFKYMWEINITERES